MNRPREEPQLFPHERDEIEKDREGRIHHKLYIDAVPEFRRSQCLLKADCLASKRQLAIVGHSLLGMVLFHIIMYNNMYQLGKIPVTRTLK